MNVQEVVCGNLLGDGSIRSQDNKYFSFKVVAKDEKFIEWLKRLFTKFNIRCWVSQDNQNIFAIWFYINTCPYPEFLSLRQKWYKQVNGKFMKTIPKDFQISSDTLFFWYLGDGSLIRRKNDSSRVPFIVLATNTFSKEDVNFLIQKLKEINLNFYPVRYKSGFTGKDCGYCLYSSTEDRTLLKFFKLIGLNCPTEIANYSTGRKGIYHEEKFFKDKWPTEEDWIKILSNVKVGKTLREKRLQLGLSQNQLARKAGVRRENIRDVELEKRNFSVRNFRIVLKALNIDVIYLLKELDKNTCQIGN